MIGTSTFCIPRFCSPVLINSIFCSVSSLSLFNVLLRKKEGSSYDQCISRSLLLSSIWTSHVINHSTALLAHISLSLYHLNTSQNWLSSNGGDHCFVLMFQGDLKCSQYQQCSFNNFIFNISLSTIIYILLRAIAVIGTQR